MAVFDAVMNNADRKIGHLLPSPDGQLFGCDHGVCFSADYKLRTVLWQWRGKRLPGNAVAALEHLDTVLGRDGDLAAELSQVAGAGRAGRHQGPGGAAHRAQGAPVPARRLARRALAPDLARPRPARGPSRA